MSTLMHGCHPDRPCRHGPTPAIIYICTADQDEATRRAEACQRWVGVRGWPLADTVTDTNPDVPLEHRDGWRTVLAAIEARKAEIIATYNPAHLGIDDDTFEAIRAQLRDEETVLVAMAGTP